MAPSARSTENAETSIYELRILPQSGLPQSTPSTSFGAYCEMRNSARERGSRSGTKWGKDVVFPTHPDLADIWGRMDSDFENLDFFDFLEYIFLDFQVPRSQNYEISR